MELQEQTEFMAETGLLNAKDGKDFDQKEINLTERLLKAADYKSAFVETVRIVRNKEVLFTVNIHPLSDTDVAFCREKATKLVPNPKSNKLPPIEAGVDEAAYMSWLIYSATVEADQQQIWGNKSLMSAKNLGLPVESVDILLKSGEKAALANRILELSAAESEENLVDFAKN